MSVTLTVLCVVAFSLAAAVVSVALGSAFPWLDRVADTLSPRHRARLWLGVAALPMAIGMLAVAVSFLPAFGLGHDHCLAHGAHHPHLCFQHAGGFPGVALVVIAALVLGRAIYTLIHLASRLHHSRSASGALAQASDDYEGVRVFPSEQPTAFVLGVVWPQIHISTGLLALGPDLVAPVVAHERVHARHRDLLWRALCPILSLGHLPFVAQGLNERLAAAQELAADAEAAVCLPNGRLRIAEALVELAKLARTPSAGIAFTDGDIKTRVHALLDGRTYRSWPALLVLAGGLLVLIAVGTSDEFIHHALETLLGALS